MLLAKLGVSSRLWASDASCRASFAFSNGMLCFRRTRVSSVALVGLAVSEHKARREAALNDKLCRIRQGLRGGEGSVDITAKGLRVLSGLYLSAVMLLSSAPAFGQAGTS